MTSLNSGYHWNIRKKGKSENAAKFSRNFFCKKLWFTETKTLVKKIAKRYPLSLVRNKQSNEIKSIIIHESVEHIVISKGKVTGKVHIHNTNETFSHTKLNFLTKSR